MVDELNEIERAMGMAGTPTTPPNYSPNALQNALANQAQNTHTLSDPARFIGGLGAMSQQYHPAPAISVVPLLEVARSKIEALISQLPMKVLAGISRIEFFDHVKPMMFVVTYTNQRTLEFTDLDAFPSDAVVARIILDAP